MGRYPKARRHGLLSCTKPNELCGSPGNEVTQVEKACRLVGRREFLTIHFARALPRRPGICPTSAMGAASTMCACWAGVLVQSNPDQEVLAGVYAELGTPPALSMELASRHCKMEGVCDSEGRVLRFRFPQLAAPARIPRLLGNLTELQVLDASNRGFFGSIPAELGQLANLQALLLQENNLSCPIPPELGRLGELRILNLSANILNGSIPYELSRLGKLTSLHLQLNYLSGGIPASLGRLRLLENLRLQVNRLGETIPAELGRLSSLKALVLASNYLDGPIPEELGKLERLQVLDLEDNLLSGELPKELGDLTQLRMLGLRGNQLSGSLVPLGNLTKLRSLRLSQNRFAGPIPRELARLRSLVHLRLHSNRLTGEIPPELGQLRSLTALTLYGNHLTGPIPPELGRLRRLRTLSLRENALEGPIPVELLELRLLVNLDLAKNKLSGGMPKDIGKLQNLMLLQLSGTGLAGSLPQGLWELGDLTGLFLDANAFEGALPKEIGNLRKLKVLVLRQNFLSGTLPKEMGELKELTRLFLDQNSFYGKIPPEIGKLRKLHSLHLHQNYFWGNIPAELGGLPQLRYLGLYKNGLYGNIPKELGQLGKLFGLALHQNRLRGAIPQELSNLTNLKRLELHRNKLSGIIPRQLFSLISLQDIDLSENRLSGAIPAELGNMTKLECLNIFRNRLSGQLPEALGQLESLQYLDLSENRLTGSIPAVGPIPDFTGASALMALTLLLHQNQLSGVMPASLTRMQNLAVLTLHGNWISGVVQPLNLKSVCADNPRFHIYSKPCPVLPRMLSGLRPEQLRAAHENCPFTFVRCGLIHPPPASLTLHRNRLSCGVPVSLNMSLVMATAVMGNMLGDGQALNATWISAEEQQHFLYYSARVLANNQLLFVAFLCLLLVAVLRGPQLHESFHWRLQTVETDPPHHALVSIIQLQTLRVCIVASAFAGLLLPAYLAGAGYYTCGQPVGKTTAGYLSDSPVMELVVCCLWCCTTTAGTVALFTMPRQRHGGHGNQTPSPRCLGYAWVCGRRIFFWMLWFFIVSTVSMPSILYSVAQALPANNTSGLSDQILAQLHRLAPILIVLLDMVLAMPLSNAYSKLTGMRADRLLMSMKLCSTWLLSLLATLLLHENCLGAWKWYWQVCDRAAPEHQMFNLELWGQPILKTDQDICQLDRSWWRDGRCSRSIIAGLAPLLLKKLLVRTLAQPFLLLATWKLSRLEDNTASSDRGRHLKLFGIWPKTTRSLEQAQQGAMLTTFLETLIFWGPLIPLVVAGVLAAVLASSWLFAVGTRNFGVRLPSSEGGLNADFSLSYMQGALFAGSAFQLWHAFGTGMCGRHLLAAHAALLLAFVCSPARRRLELDWAKALWGRSDLVTRIASEVELM
eukprot:s1516_g3.t4